MSSPVKQSFSLQLMWPTQDPFLFCAYHHDRYPKGNTNMGPDVPLDDRPLGNDFDPDKPWRMYHGHEVPGFPYHPHRGFETVTIVNKGFCDHSDSLGAAGRFGQGDAQWMTAGSGVQHAEMFPLLYQDRENPLQLFQIWLNLPAHKKLVPAHFKMLWSEDIPLIKEDGFTIQLVAGTFQEYRAPEPPPDSWAADAANNVGIKVITLKPGTELTLPAGPLNSTKSLYFFEGEQLSLNGSSFASATGFYLDPELPLTMTARGQKASMLLLEGKPINEPVAKHGPFVMNTQEEIRHAMRQYGRTQFGGWPWPSNGPVHDRKKGRFALYPDGKLEEKSGV